jgi:glycyl-tRNA synthetase
MEELIKVNDKQLISNHLTSTQFMLPSYQLYSGSTSTGGFQDYGIIGSKIKQNIITAWRKIMILNNVHEVETPIITPFCVLKASGHVDQFDDPVITDKNNVNYRADHLVENFIRDKPEYQAINLSDLAVLDEIIKQNKLIDLPDDMSDTQVRKRNLMINADSDFLRPEIAQGMFVNMKHYLDYFSNRLPFGIAQTGKSYRREISPQPFVRLREFTQAEIEYFFDEMDTKSNYYDDIKHVVLPLFTEQNQLNGSNKLILIQFDDAINNKIICNEIMAVFLAKIIEFTKYIGLDQNKLRFRQHKSDEMAHYAVECWDLECSYDNGDEKGDKWLECIGLAHRGSNDLTAHNVKGLFDMKRETYTINKKKQLNFKELNKCFDKEIIKEIGKQMNLNIEELVTMFNIPEKCISIIDEKIFDTYIPSVIEPSFGIDRLCYILLNQNMYQRKQDVSRIVMKLNANITPYKICVFQLSNDVEMTTYVKKIISNLDEHYIKTYTDFSTVSLGKKYVRADEIGIPIAITVDFQTLKDDTVTSRDIITMSQIRIHTNDIYSYLMLHKN